MNGGRREVNFGLVGLGVLLLVLIFPAVAVVWILLPSGKYPVVLVGLPAFPLLVGGLYCLQRGGLTVPDSLRKQPVLFAFLIAVGGAIMLAAIYFGVLAYYGLL